MSAGGPATSRQGIKLQVKALSSEGILASCRMAVI